MSLQEQFARLALGEAQSHTSYLFNGINFDASPVRMRTVYHVGEALIRSEAGSNAKLESGSQRDSNRER